jgi:hypothetical protein
MPPFLSGTKKEEKGKENTEILLILFSSLSVQLSMCCSYLTIRGDPVFNKGFPS